MMFEPVCNDGFDDFDQATEQGYRVVGCWVGVVGFVGFPEDNGPGHLPDGWEESVAQAGVSYEANGSVQPGSSCFDSPVGDFISARGFVWMQAADHGVDLRAGERGRAVGGRPQGEDVIKYARDGWCTRSVEKEVSLLIWYAGQDACLGSGTAREGAAHSDVV